MQFFKVTKSAKAYLESSWSFLHEMKKTFLKGPGRTFVRETKVANNICRSSRAHKKEHLCSSRNSASCNSCFSFTMELLAMQFVFLFALLILTLLGSFWPILWLKMKLESGNDSHDFEQYFSKHLSFGNCVACGAFFAICFLHLLPQSQEKWAMIVFDSNKNSTVYGHHQMDGSYPIGSFIVLLSFSVMFFAEAFFRQRSRGPFKQEKDAIPIIILTKVGQQEVFTKQQILRAEQSKCFKAKGPKDGCEVL